MWPASASRRLVISPSIARKESTEISRSSCRISTKRDMCVPLKLCGRFTYMLKVAIVCCSPAERSLTRTGWRMSLMPTRLIGKRRVSARACTSSTETILLRSRSATAMSMARPACAQEGPDAPAAANSGGGAGRSSRCAACGSHQRSMLRDDAGGVEPGGGQAVLAAAVLDEAVRNADVQPRHATALGDRAPRRTALPAPPATAFSSSVTKRGVRRRELAQQLLVERLDEAHVDDRGVEALGQPPAPGRACVPNASSASPLSPSAPQLRAAERQRASSPARSRTPGPGAARIAHRRRRVAAWSRCTASAGTRSRPPAP